MKKNILLLLIFASVIFATASCSKDGIKDKDNGMVKVTFGTPSSSSSKYIDPSCSGSVVTLEGTEFSYDISKDGSLVKSGTAAFGSVQSFELAPGVYSVWAEVAYSFTAGTLCGGGNFHDEHSESIVIEKGVVSEVTVY